MQSVGHLAVMQKCALLTQKNADCINRIVKCAIGISYISITTYRIVGFFRGT